MPCSPGVRCSTLTVTLKPRAEGLNFADPIFTPWELTRSAWASLGAAWAKVTAVRAKSAGINAKIRECMSCPSPYGVDGITRVSHPFHDEAVKTMVHPF